MITVAGLFMAATFAEAKPFRRSLLSGDDGAEYEWSAVFATEANEHTWLMQNWTANTLMNNEVGHLHSMRRPL